MSTKPNLSTFKSCFVPLCTNSSITTPNKIFIHVPTDFYQRKMWFQAVKRKHKSNILKNTAYCCEDHFDLPNDMQNWIKFQVMPNTPIVMKKNIFPHKFNSIEEKTPSKKLKLQIEVVPTKQKTFSSYLKTADIKDIRNTTLETTLNLIEKQSLFYIGVPDTAYHIVGLLSKRCNIETKNILLCLEKIKRDIGMVALANDFNTSKKTANQYFNAVVPVIAQELKQLIHWPPKHKILNNLPRIFRGKYAKVQSIISTFEINIPEPNTPFKKSVYWSEHRNAYTYKYLISWTPDGIVNYVSGNYGGKISNSLMLEVSGYLDVLPEGSEILGQGFNDVNNLFNLKERQCTLHSVENSSLAALQSHIDSMLSEFKVFQFLQPYNNIEINYLYILDNVMLIVAGLINLRNNNNNKK